MNRKWQLIKERNNLEIQSYYKGLLFRLEIDGFIMYYQEYMPGYFQASVINPWTMHVVKSNHVRRSSDRVKLEAIQMMQELLIGYNIWVNEQLQQLPSVNKTLRLLGCPIRSEMETVIV